VLEILQRLANRYPEAHLELDFSSPFELLVATVLAAQCTDARVNEVTKTLFHKYPDPAAFLSVSLAELQQDIRQITFYRNKAKGIIAACKMLVEEYDGKVPDRLDALTSLPYVGRKTANIVLANAFGMPAIGVDTHTVRVPNRLGWVDTRDADKVEEALCLLLPEAEWHRANILLQWHGRYTCQARKPKCEQCVVSGHCKWYVTNRRTVNTSGS
jgi:endonuclease-3